MQHNIARRVSVIKKHFRSIGAILIVAPFALWASHTSEPSSVTVAGDLQEELGCPGDWQPDCAATHLGFDAEDGVWQGTFNVPAGNWQYKAPLNDSWDENYGANAQPGGANIPLNLGSNTDVKFYYDHETHWITDNVNSEIATAAGNFQSELGCSGDWQPWCLQSWLQDPDGNGVFNFLTNQLPAGAYEVKVAHDEDWAENYGAGGVQNGPNIPFSVPTSCAAMDFEYDLATHVLSVSEAPAPEQPGSVTIPGSFQEELGCPGDWQPDCAVTHLGFDAEDTIWQGTFNIPAGNWEYKAALNDSWDVNYGANATQNGPNIGLSVGAPTDVKFYYDHDTNWVWDNQNKVIATLAGNFQSELGCSGDWQPWCLRSMLKDPDGDGLYTFSTSKLEAGNYEVKIAHDEDWAENYGAGGVPGGANIPFTVPSDCGEIFFTYDPVSHLLTIGTGPGTPKGNLDQAKAYWLAEDIIATNLGDVDDVYQLHYAATGGLGLDLDGITGSEGALSLTRDPAGLPADVTDKFPHLSGLDAFRIDGGDLPSVPGILTGQFALSVEEPDGTPVDATGLQIPGVLDDLYTYDGDLGPVFDGNSVVVTIWAPTAKTVSLQVFADSDPATPAGVHPMTEDPATGTWSVTGPADWNGQYYLFDVEVYVPSTGAVEHNLVTDPYSLGLSMNSQRSQFVDLDDPGLMPPGWADYAKPALTAPEDIVIYELHVRDFSVNDMTVSADNRGTYNAFAAAGSNGTNHLASLAEGGLSHVHLLPTFDIASINENKAEWEAPDPAILATYPPDSEMQQDAVSDYADKDGFNWGYDPWHYTVPEGSYATNPDGTARILEYREMVRALNEMGLRVVMDVVYNHTNASGQNDKSVLDRVVPGYYHRLNADGGIERSTCCENTASEHNMMEKLMVDSLVTWARDYKVDGFRFDLMGHHSKANMLKVRQALDALTLENDGVDGSAIYLYGEGWNFGEVANNARFEQATQRNMAGTGIGTFSDRLRDGVRGGNPFSNVQDQGFVNGLYYDSNGTPQGNELGTLLHISDWVRIGLIGDLADYELVNSGGNLVRADEVDYFGQQAGYTADPQENITYVAAHDNETLFDATQLKAPFAASMADRVRIQNLGNSIVMFGQGVPFFHAGQDILRSKSMDRDSFNSGDWFNAIDWSLATTNWGIGLPNAEKNLDNWPIMQPRLADPAFAPSSNDVFHSAEQFNELLRIRGSSRLFRLRDAAEVSARVGFHNTGPSQVPGLVVMSIVDDYGDVDLASEMIVTLFNAGDEAVSFGFEAMGRDFELHPVQAASVDPVVQSAYYDATAEAFQVPARTTAVFLAGRPVTKQIDFTKDQVEALRDADDLDRNQYFALMIKLRLAQVYVINGNPSAAAAQMRAFMLEVEALVDAGVLTEEAGAALIASAETILESLH